MKIKNLRDTHPKIYLRILECQASQGNHPNDAFEINLEALSGNFNWAFTEEGADVWGDVSLGKFESWYRHHKLQPQTIEIRDLNQFRSINILDYLSAMLRIAGIMTIFVFDYNLIISISLFLSGEVLSLIRNNKLYKIFNK
jgi:hypothetical protein